MKPQLLPIIVLFHLFLLCTAVPEHESPITSGSIIFATSGRPNYAWDVFTLPTSGPPNHSNELRVTDGESVNFNGHFPSSSPSSILSLLHNRSLVQVSGSQAPQSSPVLQLIYVTERNGMPNIYYDALYYGEPRSNRSRSRSALEIPVRVQAPLLGLEESKNWVSMKDKPSLSGENLIYVSTHEDPGEPRTSWAAVYSTHLGTGFTRRLTPYGIADFSPAVSPSGVWTAVASYGKDGWNGEVEELSTDIYVFLTHDGSHRVKVIEHGGWPCWVDDSTLYFHRKNEDQWMSVYKAILPKDKPFSTDSISIQRVTPPGLHAFTPAASPANKFIAVATRRPNSSFRHIELFDMVKNEFIELTRHVSPTSHHLNPFISPDSTRVGYHKCRGGKATQLLLENVKSPVPNLSLFRAGGSFPTFSPDGDRIAYTNFPGLYVVNRDGSNLRLVFSWIAFATAWDPVRKGIVYTSAGPTFSSETTEVDIVSINVDDASQSNYKKLTMDGKNNAFPSPSPDGKQIVFRSGRSGHKNLYIMNAIEGEIHGLQRLTEGPWTDTMCNWSPDGNWIAFASDRHNPGSGSFELYLIHPNGTGLRKLISSRSSGRTNHPWFSPDGKLIVFTTDYGGISAEPISNPHQYQPYGEIYTIKPDGSDLRRLTHNSYEDGTPSWAPFYINPVDVESSKEGRCAFEDCHFLNEMSGRGTTVEPSGLAKPQCGA